MTQNYKQNSKYVNYCIQQLKNELIQELEELEECVKSISDLDTFGREPRQVEVFARETIVKTLQTCLETKYIWFNRPEFYKDNLNDCIITNLPVNPIIKKRINDFINACSASTK